MSKLLTTEKTVDGCSYELRKICVKDKFTVMRSGSTIFYVVDENDIVYGLRYFTETLTEGDFFYRFNTIKIGSEYEVYVTDKRHETYPVCYILYSKEFPILEVVKTTSVRCEFCGEKIEEHNEIRREILYSPDMIIDGEKCVTGRYRFDLKIESDIGKIKTICKHCLLDFVSEM